MISDRLYAGTTWAWTVDVPGYSAADGWGLNYILTNASASFDFSDDDSATGTTFSVEVAGASTTACTEGDYTWQLFAVKDDDRRFVSSGSVKVLPDISDGSTHLDSRSHARKVLDAVGAVIEGSASKDQQSYSVNGRSLSRRSLDELQKLRGHYLAEVRAEESEAAQATGKTNSNQIKAVFARS